MLGLITSIQWLFLSILILFYAVYLIKMLALKSKGIKGNLLGKGSKPKKAIIIETILKLITLVGVVIQFASVAFTDKIWSLPVTLPVQIVGVALGGIGLIFFVLSVATMKKNWRAGFDDKQDTKLVTSGVYQISRNPAFVGFDLLYIGCALAFPNIINVIASIIAVGAFHFQILGEEMFLVKTFGKTYNDYKAKVRRYL